MMEAPTAVDIPDATAGTAPLAALRRIPARLLAFYLMFAISGFCGLIYESLWTKYLRLFLGHAAYAQTVVLVVFIGGMAIGAALCARFTTRIRTPLIAYAIVEFIIGLFAIRFHTHFVALTDWGYSTLLPATCDTTSWCVSSWLLASALILPQSVLLGMTFPLMAAGILRAYPAGPGRKLSLLYFLNSFGAVFGVLVSTFVLVPWVGLPGATLTAGLMNAALAVIVYFLARTQEHGTTRATTTRAAPTSVPAAQSVPESRLLITIAFLTGLSSFIYEIVWIRMLALVLGSSNDAFELMLASFILGIALGGLWVRRRIDTTADPARFLGYVQIFMGLFALATIPFYNMSFDAMAWMLSALGHEDSSYFLFNVGSALIAMAMMLPATFMAGMTLPLLTYLLLRRGAGERSIGIIYSANTLGSIGGVLLGIHIGLPLLGVQNSLKFACLIDVVLGTAILLSIKSGREATSRWVAVTSVVTIVACITLAIDPLRSASGVFRLGSATLSGSERIEFHRDGKTATVDTIRSSSGVVSIRTNGKTDAGIQMRRAGRKPSPDEFTMMLAAVLPLAYKPDIASAAVIGFGSGLTTATLLASPNVRRVDTVEIEPAIVEGARLFLPRVERAYFDPRSRIIFDDAKSFFARSKGSYDLIVSEPSNPWVSGTASLFTEEFYVRIRGYLNEDGLFVQWIQAYEFNPRLFASIVNALGSTFPAFIMYGNGTDLMIVASKNGHLGEPSHRIFEWKQLASDLEPLGIVSLRDLRSRKIASRQVMERLLAAERAPANSDYFPYVEMYAPRARFRQENAIFVLALASGPIPVIEMMERWPAGPSERASAPPDSTLARQLSARAADRYIDFLDDSRPGAAEAVPADLDAPLIAAYRMALVDCVSLENTAALWDQVIRLGEIIGSSGDPETGQRFWRTAEESRCLTKLPSYYRDWIALLGSVSARDPVRTEQLAESLLEFRDKTYSQIEYLILASAAGRLAQGKTELARATVNEAFKALLPDRRKLPRFEMIRRLAGE